MTTKTDLVELSEARRAILAHADAPLETLEERVRELKHVVASSREIARGSPLSWEIEGPMPPRRLARLDKRLDTLDLPPGAFPVDAGQNGGDPRSRSCR